MFGQVLSQTLHRRLLNYRFKICARLFNSCSGFKPSHYAEPPVSACRSRQTVDLPFSYERQIDIGCVTDTVRTGKARLADSYNGKWQSVYKRGLSDDGRI